MRSLIRYGLAAIAVAAMGFVTAGISCSAAEGKMRMPERGEGKMRMPAVEAYGSMTLLAGPGVEGAWWPDSLRAVLVSHVGRHGARYLSSESKVLAVEDALNRARVAGSLTRKGIEAMGILEQVRAATGTNWGMLTRVGFAEESMIAEQMTGIAPSLFKCEAGGCRVEGIATEVPRVVETMYALNTGLARFSGDLEIRASDGKEFSPWLRFFTTDRDYVRYLESGPWRGAYDTYYNKVVPTRPAAQLVGDGWSRHDLQKLTMAMYGVMQGMPAAGLDISRYEWFEDDEMGACASVSNYQHYLQRCANPYSDEPARAAIPLLRLILSLGMPEGEAPSGTVALLRFGHAETVLPLFSLMGLPGCDDSNLTPENLSETFDVGKVSPLGANLQLYYLEGPSGVRYVAALLNGRVVSPVPGGGLIVSEREFELAMNERIARFERSVVR